MHVRASLQRAQDFACTFRLRIRYPQLDADRQPPLPVRQRDLVVADMRVDPFGREQAARDVRFDRIVVAGDDGEMLRRT
jgi:hypothetical protein